MKNVCLSINILYKQCKNQTYVIYGVHIFKYINECILLNI